ncbi:MAG TPA: hypothetical protein VMW72_17445 [Sedimentisphaerales bacterium]|nr:hypothetical protein [Sedimentisphaerales bacterium]
MKWLRELILMVVTITIFIALLLLVSSCKRTDYAVGDEIEFEEPIDIYLKVSNNKSYVLEKELVEHLVSNSEWFLHPDIEIIEKSINAKAWPIRWAEEGTQYTAKGMRLWAKAKVKVQKNCPKGRYQLRLYLPHLQALTSKIGAIPYYVRFPSGRVARALPDQVHQLAPEISGKYIFTVRDFDIHESKKDAEGAHSKGVMLSLGIIIVVIIIFIIGSALMGN